MSRKGCQALNGFFQIVFESDGDFVCSGVLPDVESEEGRTIRASDHVESTSEFGLHECREVIGSDGRIIDIEEDDFIMVSVCMAWRVRGNVGEKSLLDREFKDIRGRQAGNCVWSKRMYMMVFKGFVGSFPAPDIGVSMRWEGVRNAGTAETAEETRVAMIMEETYLTQKFRNTLIPEAC